MPEEVENLVLEHLRAIRGDVSELKRRQGNVEQSLNSISHHTAVLVGDMANVRERFTEVEVRLDRIERRLSLAED